MSFSAGKKIASVLKKHSASQKHFTRSAAGVLNFMLVQVRADNHKNMKTSRRWFRSMQQR